MGDQDAASEALAAAHGDNRAKIMRKGAGDHNDLADQKGGRNPGTIVDTDADAAFDVRAARRS
jgi:hypothetical protein